MHHILHRFLTQQALQLARSHMTLRARLLTGVSRGPLDYAAKSGAADHG